MFSLFFISFIRHFRCVDMYRSSVIIKNSIMNSFHIRNNVQNFQFRHSLNVINVCKKNCSSNQITKILHNKIIRNLIGFEQMLDRRDVSFFILFMKTHKMKYFLFF